ncbi:MAG: hypothetical protein KJ607_07740, partial [Bacteroidetes bacterium]|nr:hypothetical protein [Bacteroidota bacterium]
MKIVTILIISTIVTLPLFAQQQIIFEEAKPEAYLVKYESGNQHTIKNDIIRTIAKSIPKNLYRTEFSYSYIQRTRIVRNGYNLDLKAELTDVEMKGDIRYRGFNVGDVLLPGKISFRMNLTDLQNKRLIFHDFQDIPLEGTPIVLIDYAHTDSSNHTFRMDIVNKQFIYDAGCKQAFDARAQFVDSYYNSDIQLKSGFRQLQLIDLNNTDLLFDYRKVAENVDALINSLQAFDFHRNLDLDLYDPISFEQKFSDLYELNAEIKNKLDYMLTHLYEVYYDKGMWFLGSGNIEMARLNFNKSVNAGLMFAPAHYQLAMLDFDEGKLRQAETNILNITGKMNPDPKTLSLTIELAGKIFDIYLKETGKYLDSGKYDFAIEELKKAQNLCEKIRGLHCSNHYHDLWTRAANGKMNEYLDKANTAIAARAFEDAKELIKTARLFKTNYSRY